MYRVYINDFLPDSPLGAVKAIRDAMRVVDEDAKATDARKNFERFQAQNFDPLWVVEALTEDVAAAALAALEAGGCGGFVKEYDPDDAEPEADTEEDDGTPSPKEYSSAMALMAFAGGNPSVARAYAFTLVNATQDEFWLEVAATLVTVFPIRDEN